MKPRWSYVGGVILVICVVMLIIWILLPATPPKVVLVVRHAEPASGQGSDPQLSAAGQARSAKLAHVASDAQVGAVFASHLQRTQLTVQPLASAMALDVTVVNALAVDELAGQIRAHDAQTVLVAGHSNTVPQIVSELSGVDPGGGAETEFDNFFLIYLPRYGPGRVVHLHYGEET